MLKLLKSNDELLDFRSILPPKLHMIKIKLLTTDRDSYISSGAVIFSHA